MELVTISEASRRSGISAKIIRYYEEKGLIPRATRAKNNYRSYSVADVDLLRLVGCARSLGFTFQEVQDLIELNQNYSRSSLGFKHLVVERLERIDKKIAGLMGIRQRLQELARNCGGGNEDEFAIPDEIACRRLRDLTRL